MVSKDQFRVIERKIQLLENSIFQFPVATKQGGISFTNKKLTSMKFCRLRTWLKSID